MKRIFAAFTLLALAVIGGIGAAFILLVMPGISAGQSASAGVSPHNVANITGTGATVHIYAAGALARKIQFIAASGNSAAIEIGDSTTTSTTGNPVAAGGGYNCEPLCPITNTAAACSYGLQTFYAYIANGDKLSVVAYW